MGAKTIQTNNVEGWTADRLNEIAKGTSRSRDALCRHIFNQVAALEIPLTRDLLFELLKQFCLKFRCEPVELMLPQLGYLANDIVKFSREVSEGATPPIGHAASVRQQMAEGGAQMGGLMVMTTTDNLGTGVVARMFSDNRTYR